jgi:hypothetical protein
VKLLPSSPFLLFIFPVSVLLGYPCQQFLLRSLTGHSILMYLVLGEHGLLLILTLYTWVAVAFWLHLLSLLAGSHSFSKHQSSRIQHGSFSSAESGILLPGGGTVAILERLSNLFIHHSSGDGM